MNIEEAKAVTLRTHIAALKKGERANGRYFVSGPGIGKSEGVVQETQELAKILGEPVGIVVEMLASYSSVDVRGFMLPVKAADGTLDTIWSTPSWYPKIQNMRVVEPNGTWHEMGEWKGAVPRVGNLFLDEFAQAEEEVQKPAAELILNGRVGTSVLPRGWQVISAGNRVSDRSGVMRELMFLVSRRCRLAISASVPAWLDWASRQPDHNRPHYMTVSFAQKEPDIVFRDRVPDGTDPFCTPRTLCLMDKDLQALRSDADLEHDRIPTDNIAREVCAGWIGDGAAAQFFTFLKYADELPDLEDIERDPAKAKLPKGQDAQMVCAYMLAHRVTEENSSAIVKYITRLSREMQILAVKATMANPERAKALYAAKEYNTWLMNNKDVIKASYS